MRALLIADANSSIGWGHVMRVTALGEKLVQRGHSVVLRTSSLPQPLEDVMRSRGIEVVETSVELLRTIDAIRADCVVVDDYDPVRWFATRKIANPVTVIQICDSGTNSFLDEAILVRPDPLRSPGDRSVIGGIEYLLIGSDVVDFPRVPPEGRAGVFVSLGGSARDLEEKLTSELTTNHGVTAISGFSLMSNSSIGRSDFVHGLASARLAIVGSGTAVWECGYLRTPLVAVCLAQNQEAQWRWISNHKLGIAVSLEKLLDFLLEIDRALSAETPLTEMAERFGRLVDGRGSERIAQLIESHCG